MAPPPSGKFPSGMPIPLARGWLFSLFMLVLATLLEHNRAVRAFFQGEQHE